MKLWDLSAVAFEAVCKLELWVYLVLCSLAHSFHLGLLRTTWVWWCQAFLCTTRPVCSFNSELSALNQVGGGND